MEGSKNGLMALYDGTAFPPSRGGRNLAPVTSLKLRSVAIKSGRSFENDCMLRIVFVWCVVCCVCLVCRVYCVYRVCVLVVLVRNVV